MYDTSSANAMLGKAVWSFNRYQWFSTHISAHGGIEDFRLALITGNYTGLTLWKEDT